MACKRPPVRIRYSPQGFKGSEIPVLFLFSHIHPDIKRGKITELADVNFNLVSIILYRTMSLATQHFEIREGFAVKLKLNHNTIHRNNVTYRAHRSRSCI